MKIEIENLKILISGRNLSTYQMSLAMNEWNKMQKYIEELEKTTPRDNNCNILTIISVPSRKDAENEGKNRFKGRNHVLWKSRIFAAGAMWAKMKLTGISEVT